MSRKILVTGMNYGDEGKGKVIQGITSYYMKENEKVLGIRYDNGPQSGHTVMIDTPNGVQPFTFSTYPSAIGADPSCENTVSYIGRNVLFHPYLAINELHQFRNAIQALNFPEMVINVYCELLTPYDIAYQRAMNIFNDAGTVGLGIAIAKKRIAKGISFNLLAAMTSQIANEKLNFINEYLRNKAISYGVLQKYTEEVAAQMEFQKSLQVGESNNEFYLNLPGLFLSSNIKVVIEKLDRDVIQQLDNEYNFEGIIIEETQGMLLGKTLGGRNQTWTDPGLTNYQAITGDTSTGDNDIMYFYLVTRAYITRHGGSDSETLPSGYLKFKEGVDLTDPNQESNVENQYQGKLETSGISADHILNMMKLYEIQLRTCNVPVVNSMCHLVVNHCDQVTPESMDVLFNRLQMLLGSSGLVYDWCFFFETSRVSGRYLIEDGPNLNLAISKYKEYLENSKSSTDVEFEKELTDGG